MSTSRVRRILPVVVVLAAAAAILWWTVLREGPAGTALAVSGTVEATEVQLGFQAGGRVESLAVREGDAVKAGQELATLDRTETLARRAQAVAGREAARAGLAELESGFRREEIAQASAAREAARARLDDAARDRERTARLFQAGAVSQEASEKAALAEAVARSVFEQAEEQVRILESGPRRERIAAQRAQVEAADAAVAAIDAVLANMTVVTPTDGIVTLRHREPGESVPPGAPVFTVMDPADRWVRIYVPEDRIGAVALKQSASIRSDTWPDREYQGEVAFIASEAEFTPKNVQTPEERVKLVYAVKVRITGDPGGELKPGMPADVRLDIGAR